MAIHVSSYLDISQLPRACINDCSASGSVDAAVAHWRGELGFTVDRDRALRCLRGYGAWEPEELADMGDERLAGIVLWQACCDFREFIHEAERAGVDPLNRPEDFSPGSGSDIFCLE